MVRFRYAVPHPKHHPVVSSAEGLLAVPAYQIDAQDIVVTVNEAWSASAHAHGRPDLAPPQVLGQSLWQCIRAPAVRAWYAPLLARLRAVQGTAVIPFWCEAPAGRRCLQLSLTAGADHAVAFVARTVRMAGWGPGALCTLEGRRAPQWLTICRWCTRIRRAEGLWVAVDQALGQPVMWQEEPWLQLTHSVCPTCAATVLAALSEDKGGSPRYSLGACQGRGPERPGAPSSVPRLGELPSGPPSLTTCWRWPRSVPL
jgi:hypothetical protein